MPLAEIGKASKEVISDHQLQYRITEKLQTLIGWLTLMLSTPRTMCQRMGEKTGIVEPVTESILKGCQKRNRTQRSAQLGNDILDGIAHCAEVFKIFIFDTETDRALGELLFDCFHKLDQGQRVGIEVIGERITLVNTRRLDLKDLRETILHQGDDLITADWTLFDMSFGRHGIPFADAGVLAQMAKTGRTLSVSFTCALVNTGLARNYAQTSGYFGVTAEVR